MSGKHRHRRLHRLGVRDGQVGIAAGSNSNWNCADFTAQTPLFVAKIDQKEVVFGLGRRHQRGFPDGHSRLEHVAWLDDLSRAGTDAQTPGVAQTRRRERCRRGLLLEGAPLPNRPFAFRDVRCALDCAFLLCYSVYVPKRDKEKTRSSTLRMALAIEAKRQILTERISATSPIPGRQKYRLLC